MTSYNIVMWRVYFRYGLSNNSSHVYDNWYRGRHYFEFFVELAFVSYMNNDDNCP